MFIFRHILIGTRRVWTTPAADPVAVVGPEWHACRTLRPF
jgi:hypothetical protein